MVLVPAQATTYNVSTCQYGDVNAAINNTAPTTMGSPQATAVDGDIINVPSGTCSWTSQLLVNGVGISVIGAGQGSTVINSNLAGGIVLIRFQPLVTSQTSRLSGMTINHVAGNRPAIEFFGACNSSTCSQIRLDHVSLPSNWADTGIPDSAVTVYNDVFGVVDHNIFGDTSLVDSSHYNSLNIMYSNWKGVGTLGDNGMADGNSFGTNQAIYIEDNTFNYAMGTDTDYYSDGATGSAARIVCRFNTFNNLNADSACGGHGTETGGRPRGLRAAEFYANTVNVAVSNATGLGMRGGIGYQFGNNFTGVAAQYLLTFNNERVYRETPWGLCNGVDPYDVDDGLTVVTTNSTISSIVGDVITVSGTPWTGQDFSFSSSSPKAVYYLAFDTASAGNSELAGILSNTSNSLTVSWRESNISGYGFAAGTFQVGDPITVYSVTLYAAGTHTGSAGATTLSDSSKNWTLNQWFAYSFIDVAPDTGGWSVQITSNTAGLNTSTATGIVSETRNQVAWTGFAANDPYIIVRATACIDQPGRYGGSLMSGSNLAVPVPPPVAQTLSPSYQVYDGGNAASVSTAKADTNNEQINRDYYVYNPNFVSSGGASGTGYGPRSSRPLNCAAGTAWFATDQGSWNTSGKTYGPSSITQGVLDICTATNTWTNGAYVPYTYPHPLTAAPTSSGGSASSGATTISGKSVQN